MADVAQTNGTMEQMMASFADAQAIQAQITAETSKHQSIMNALKAVQSAFQQIKG